MTNETGQQTAPFLSVVIPFYNEEECIEEVCLEVQEALAATVESGWELVMVDDGSHDRTAVIADGLVAAHAHFRCVHLLANRGQSAAIHAGIHAARGELIATLDGDGQNDPADIAGLLEAMRDAGVDMMCGVRARRRDAWLRRASGRLANKVRSFVLGDHITDVGCSLRVFRRDCALRINFFRNAHRFLPALFQMQGFSVAEQRVNHRPRAHGTSKYGRGVGSRLWAGLVDLAGVLWLKRRALSYTTRVVEYAERRHEP